VTLYIETGFDLAKIGALSFTLAEAGVDVGNVQMTTGTYFLTIDGTTITKPDGETSYDLDHTPFTTALKTALEAVGAGTYTISHSVSTQLFTISVAGVASFSMHSFNTVGLKVLGYTSALGNATSHTAARAPWYRLQATQGILSDYFWDEEEDGDLGEDVVAHDGTTFALAEDEVPVRFDAMVPLEPKAMLWNEFAATAVPFTWQRLFAHARNVEPVCLDFADGSITRKFFVRFRRDGRLFKPVPRQTKNWWDYGDVEIRARLLGKT
jgi:hypothetical protein